jgi:hypothetical protein
MSVDLPTRSKNGDKSGSARWGVILLVLCSQLVIALHQKSFGDESISGSYTRLETICPGTSKLACWRV